MRLILLVHFSMVFHFCFSQQLDNTIKKNQNNIFYHALQQIVNKHHEELVDKVIIIEVEQAGNVITEFEGLEVLNSKDQLIYWTNNRKLHKNFTELIGRDLIRLIVREISIEDSKIRFSILLSKARYKSRSRREVEIWKDGLWLFEYQYRNGFFELEEIDRGITL